jgi:lipopolysaccharide transport system ATP-binding protein
MVRALCDDALYLRSGEVVAFGPAHEVMSMYEAFSREGGSGHDGSAADRSLPDGHVLRAGLNRIGSFEAEIRNVRLLKADGTPARTLLSGSGLTVEFEYDSREPLGLAIAGVRVQREDGTLVLDANTDLAGRNVSTDAPGTVRLVIDRLDLEGGDYTVDVALYPTDWSYTYDSHLGVYPLAIIGRGTSNALLDPPVTWEVAEAAAGIEAPASASPRGQAMVGADSTP